MRMMGAMTGPICCWPGLKSVTKPLLPVMTGTPFNPFCSPGAVVSWAGASAVKGAIAITAKSTRRSPKYLALNCMDRFLLMRFVLNLDQIRDRDRRDLVAATSRCLDEPLADGVLRTLGAHVVWLEEANYILDPDTPWRHSKPKSTLAAAP